MNLSILTIGQEILIGQIVDTNSAWIATELNKKGFEVVKILSIADNEQEIINALDYLGLVSDIVLITGGLGPTNDDITKETLAKYFNSRLVLNNQVFEHIKDFLGSKGVIMNDLNKQQAYLPDNCKVLFNKLGSAAGMLFEKDNKYYISMPGVPHEMKYIAENCVFPFLKKFSDHIVLHKTLHIIGIPESEMADRLSDFEKNLQEGLSLAYLPSPGVLRLRLTAIGNDERLVNEILKTATNSLQDLVHDNFIGYDDTDVFYEISRLLESQKMTLSTAESCTGGKIASLITSHSGASSVFKGSVIAYSNEIKTNVLDVNESDLLRDGAVSKVVVEQMALNVKKIFNTDCSIAVSGVAGSGGGTNEKPVGTTWVAISTPHTLISNKFSFSDNRERNIQKAALYATFMLFKELKAKS